MYPLSNPSRGVCFIASTRRLLYLILKNAKLSVKITYICIINLSFQYTHTMSITTFSQYL